MRWGTPHINHVPAVLERLVLPQTWLQHSFGKAGKPKEGIVWCIVRTTLTDHVVLESMPSLSWAEWDQQAHSG